MKPQLTIRWKFSIIWSAFFRQHSLRITLYDKWVQSPLFKHISMHCWSNRVVIQPMSFPLKSQFVSHLEPLRPSFHFLNEAGPVLLYDDSYHVKSVYLLEKQKHCLNNLHCCGRFRSFMGNWYCRSWKGGRFNSRTDVREIDKIFLVRNIYNLKWIPVPIAKKKFYDCIASIFVANCCIGDLVFL